MELLLYIIGLPLVLLMLGLDKSATPIKMIPGMIMWAIAGALAAPAMEHIRRYRKHPPAGDDKIGEIYEITALGGASFFSFLIGTSINGTIISWGKVLLLLLAFACFGTAWWLKSRYHRRREEWRGRATGGRRMEYHRTEVLSYLISIPVLVTVGLVAFVSLY